MSAPVASVARTCTRCIRSSPASFSARSGHIAAFRVQQHNSRRWQSTEAAAPSNPKIASIVDQISQLTLLETADLVSSLKSRLNIPDMPMGGFSAGPAPAAAPAAAEEPEDAAPAKEEKTLFNLKLESFEATAKPKVIKEIKSMLGLSLVDSKKFVESAPKLMKEAVPKEEAEKIIATLKALGAVVKME
ncbi:ClpS-like protein [Dissoconium aciculare CBS 342.82]|uniref:ClpS-like protein n=1 Tax=Dissoconium aciculare CBS 342.82 TaxID=1314786 RepID=A0A6J3M2L5_9PEZI|nr:ClpS-like protein [Dissoconium aciculare CBS 342.82]KAF1822266.1 ClpS-like protein [Dissoconium aciculare CBS 342.82]